MIATIFLLSIAVILGTVMAVWASDLGRPPEKAEDAAFTVTSPHVGQIYVTMMRMGEHGPYSIDTADAVSTDDVAVFVDSNTCDVRPGTGADEEEFLALGDFPAQFGSGPSATSAPATGGQALWSVGEVMLIANDCTGGIDGAGVVHPSAAPLTSNMWHQVRVVVRNVVLFDDLVLVR